MKKKGKKEREEREKKNKRKTKLIRVIDGSIQLKRRSKADELKIPRLIDLFYQKRRTWPNINSLMMIDIDENVIPSSPKPRPCRAR